MKPSTLTQPLMLGAFALAALIGGTDIAGAQSLNQSRISIQSTSTSLEGGSNVGGSDDHFGTDATDPWADGVVDTLIEHAQIAVQAFADGSTQLAIQHYKKGLELILQTANAQQNRLSWTYKISERTLELANRLEASADQSSEKDLRPIVTLLQSSYQLIEQYYYSLDIQYLTPYRMYCANPQGRIPAHYDVIQFENMLRTYSLKQIAWFQNKFVMNTDQLGVVPRYSGRVFLITLASVARGLSDDLSGGTQNPNPSLFPLAYGQAARSLAKLSDQIEQHLAGNGIFGNDQRAVNFTYERLLQIVSYINGLQK
jgi:hypothetical protein